MRRLTRLKRLEILNGWTRDADIGYEEEIALEAVIARLATHPTLSRLRVQTPDPLDSRLIAFLREKRPELLLQLNYGGGIRSYGM